jgi:periodic tryptophan protein 1
MESGEVMCIDARFTSTSLSTFQAHESTVTSIGFSSKIPGMMATASVDKTVRVWDTVDTTSEESPKLVAYKSMNVGKLFTLHFSFDDPFLLATAGDQGLIAIWESSEIDALKSHFSNRIVEDTSSLLSRNEEFHIGSQDDVNGVVGMEQDTTWMDVNDDQDDKDKKKKKKKKDKTKVL